MGKEKAKKGSGDGTWRTLPSGKVNWYRTYTSKNGEKARLSVTGKDKTECRRLMRLKEENFETKSRMDLSTRGLLADNMENWLLLIKRNDPNCGDTAFTRLLSTFETHVKSSYLGRMKEEQIRDRDITQFLSELKKHSSDGKALNAPLSFSSRKKVYELLSMYFSHKYIRAHELNPMLTVPALTRDRYIKKDGTSVVEDDDDTDSGKVVPLSTVWNDEEMAAIHKYCMREYAPGKKGSVKRGPLIAFLLWTSIRAGELRALKWQDVHLDEGYISITKSWKKRGNKGSYEWYIGKPKSRRSVRNIQLLPEAIAAIKEYKRRFPPQSEGDFVCVGDDGRVLCAKVLNDCLASTLRGLGYDKLQCKNKTVHGLRHAGISYLIRKGADRNVVSALAGHSSTTITEQVYTEIISEYCRDEITKIGSLV